MLRVAWDAIHRAHLLALRFIVVADTFGALVRVDHVDVDTHRNSVVRALGLAYVAVDALIGNEQGHALLSSSGISPAFLVPARLDERALASVRKRSRHRWVLRNRTDLVLQALFHRWKNKLADIAAE